jgi:4-hydroxybenzoate polyprenyltransferase
MNNLFHQIESGTIKPVEGLMVAVIFVVIVFIVCYLLPENKKVR